MIEWLIFLLIWFIIGILLCVWVYRDAKARGENAALWLITVLLIGIVGLIIWLIVRPKQAAPPLTVTVTCPSCGRKLKPGAKFCPFCGKEVAAEKANTCPSCGAKLKLGAKFCTSCGKKVSQ